MDERNETTDLSRARRGGPGDLWSLDFRCLDFRSARSLDFARDGERESNHERQSNHELVEP